VSTPFSAYDARVAAMFRAMYGASRFCSLGLTWKRCTTAGTIPPATIAHTTSSPAPSTGSRHDCSQMEATNTSPTTTAAMARKTFAGSTAWTSV
jgi:hypothetical protein